MKPYVANVTTPVGTFGVEGTDENVTAVYLPNEPRRASKGPAPRAVGEAARQLGEYFAGRRQSFDVTLGPVESTDFQRDVWEALVRIPYGEVRTYAEVAESVERPRASRAVGNANHANPWPVFVPCHRVVAAAGLGGYGGGDTVKRFLLDLEGATI